MFDPSQSILAGLTTAQLQANLAAAQQAYADLMSGAKVASASYSQGDGARSVTYQQTNLQQLVSYIRLLQAQLGIATTARRPVRFNFR